MNTAHKTGQKQVRRSCRCSSTKKLKLNAFFLSSKLSPALGSKQTQTLTIARHNFSIWCSVVQQQPLMVMSGLNESLCWCFFLYSYIRSFDCCAPQRLILYCPVHRTVKTQRKCANTHLGTPTRHNVQSRSFILFTLHLISLIN